MLETILESTSIKKYQHLRSERFEHVIYIYISFYHFGHPEHLRLNSDSESAPTEWAQQTSHHLRRFFFAKKKG